MERQQFIYMIEPERPEMPESPTQEEMKLVAEHFAYLKENLASGNLVLAGRTMESPHLGIAIFEAADAEDAMRFAQNDPAIRGGVFRLLRVQPYRVALLRS